MPKERKPAWYERVDWYSLGVLASRVVLCFCLMNLGYWIFSESGERIFNKYMHSARK